MATESTLDRQTISDPTIANHVKAQYKVPNGVDPIKELESLMNHPVIGPFVGFIKCQEANFGNDQQVEYLTISDKDNHPIVAIGHRRQGEDQFFNPDSGINMDICQGKVGCLTLKLEM